MKIRFEPHYSGADECTEVFNAQVTDDRNKD